MRINYFIYRRQSVLYFLALCLYASFPAFSQNIGDRPNILFCIADDASLEHLSAYKKTNWVQTPGFDRVAKEGLLFTRAYTPNAKCSPSRACILTGRNPWQLEEAANHFSYFPARYDSFMEVLAANGYFTGFTGKGWSPGEPGKKDGQPRMLTGKRYSDLKTSTPTNAISNIDYAANFKEFLKDKKPGQPFCFWFGSHEPHRQYAYGSGINKGKKTIRDISFVPPYWIDNEQTRTDMLDYAFELEYFDKQLQKVLAALEESGELDNTLIVVTSDNGMPFPRVKGFVYEFANHLPLAVMWKKGIKKPGRNVEQLVSFIDFAPTFLELAKVKKEKNTMQPVQGKSLVPLLKSDPQQVKSDYILLGRERTDVGRPNDEGYPVRGLVKDGFIYTRNYEPDRWPSGNPETGYLDTDGSPTKTQILEANRKGTHREIWELNFGKKGEDELYDINKDPYCMDNLATHASYRQQLQNMRAFMETELKKQGDPRMYGKGYIFDKYPTSSDAKDFYTRFMNGERSGKMNRGKNDIDPENP